MKRFLLVVLVASSLAACKKNGVSPSVNIVGKWELHERKGGFIQPMDSTYTAGNGNIYQFNRDGSYQEYFNGTLSINGTYRLNKDTLYYNNSSYSDQASYSLIAVSGNTLIFRPQTADMGTMIYNKLQN
jgi:hypothetical protein